METIFFGGGTPTLLAEPLWDRILQTLHHHYDLSRMGNGPGEFTVECNPETARDSLFDLLGAGGVNRLSMGAQSFDRAHLHMLERRHDPESVSRAMDCARRAGFHRVSLDLIHSIPGQSLESWREDLERAVSLGPEHLSCYSLTYEPNTAMTARLKRGEFEPASEDLEIAMMREGWNLLAAHGYERYEVSNFARPGAECRHNMVYWRCGPWLAAGPSASGHVAGHRWKNVPRLDDYLGLDDEGFAAIVDHEPPDESRALREHVWLGLRLAEGVDEQAMLAQAGRTARVRHVLDSALRRGLIRVEHGRWILTDAGVLLADSVASEFMAAID